jgi:hypothetical protein
LLLEKTIYLKQKKISRKIIENGVINMRPENAPVLKGKCAEEFIRKMGQPLSQKQLKTFEDADKVFTAIRPRK